MSQYKKLFSYYFPEWRIMGDETTQKNITDTFYNGELIFPVDQLLERVKYSTWTYTRDNLNFYPIYAIIGIFLFTYPNYRFFYNPIKKLTNFLWSKVNLKGLGSSLFFVVLFIILLYSIFCFAYSSLLSSINMYRSDTDHEYSSMPGFLIGILLMVFTLIIPLIWSMRSKDLINKISLMCQTWYIKQNSITLALKKYLLALNYILCSKYTQVVVGISVLFHIIVGCHLTFVPYKNNTVKKNSIIITLIGSFVSFLMMTFMSSLSGNHMRPGKIFTGLMSNVLLVIVITMLVCITSGLVTYSQLQSAILGSKFTFYKGDDKSAYVTAKNTLRMSTKSEMITNAKDNNPDRWKQYINDTSTGVKDFNYEAVENIFDQTQQGIYNIDLMECKLRSNPSALKDFNTKIKSKKDFWEDQNNFGIKCFGTDGSPFACDKPSNFNNLTPAECAKFDSALYAALNDLITQSNLSVSPNSLYLILKLNNKVLYSDNSTSSKPGTVKVFLRTLLDLVIYTVNVVLVSTFINGSNWMYMPVIGFDTGDESFTFKNFVNCIVNPYTNKIIINTEWDGGSFGPTDVNFKAQYKKLMDQQIIIRERQMESYLETFTSKTKNKDKLIAENLELVWDMRQLLFYLPTVKQGSDKLINLSLDQPQGSSSNPCGSYDCLSDPEYAYLYNPLKMNEAIQVSMKNDQIAERIKTFIYNKLNNKIILQNTPPCHQLNSFVKTNTYKNFLNELKNGRLGVKEINIDKLNNLYPSSTPSNPNKTHSTLTSSSLQMNSQVDTFNKSVPGPAERIANFIDISTILNKIGMDTEKRGDKLMGDETEGTYKDNLDSGNKKWESNMMAKLCKFGTLFLVKLVSSNFITNSTILYILFIAGIVIELGNKKRSFLEGLVHHVTGYYEYNSASYQYHLGAGTDYCSKICDISGLKEEEKSKLEFKKDNEEYINTVEKEKSNVSINTTNKEGTEEPQIGGNSTSKIPKYPTLKYLNDIKNFDIINYRCLNIDSNEYNLGTEENPIFADVCSSHPKTSVTAYLKEKDLDAPEIINQIAKVRADVNQNDMEKSNLIENIKKNAPNLKKTMPCSFYTGPVRRLYEFNEGGLDDNTYQTIMGSVTAVESGKELLCLTNDESNSTKLIKSDKLNSLRFCDKSSCVQGGVKNSCGTTWDGIVNVEVNKKGFIQSLLTKFAFLGIDLKKLFLERSKYTMPQLECDQGKMPGGLKFKQLILNNWYVGILVAIIAIQAITPRLVPFLSYIPPNMAFGRMASFAQRKFLYQTTEGVYSSNFYQVLMVLVIGITLWVIVKFILNAVLGYGAAISTIDAKHEFKFGECEIAAVVAPILHPIDPSTGDVQSGGGVSTGRKLEKYPIRIGRNDSKQYANKFYKFYKLNAKGKYKSIKNLYINPVLEQLKVMGNDNSIKKFSYNSVILNNIIEKL